MTPQAVSTDLKQLRSAANMQRGIIAALSGALVLCLLMMMQMVGRERTILVPPVIEKSFWVANDKVSGSYLEQMAAFVAYLVLDVSPSSVEWKKNMLLKYSAALSTSELAERQTVEAERLRQMNATTQFAVTGIYPHEDTMTVAIGGKLSTFINGQRTTEEDKQYLVRFAYVGNRILVKAFEEKAFADERERKAKEQAHASAQ